MTLLYLFRIKKPSYRRSSPTKKSMPFFARIKGAIKLKRGSNLMWTGGFCLLGVLLGIVGIVLVDPGQWFTVKQIHCSWESRSCPTQAQTILDRALGNPILGFDTSGLERLILFNNPTIGEITIRKLLPDKLEVSFSSRKPIAVIQDALYYQYLIDENQVVFAPSQDHQLPLIRFQETVTIGETVVNPLITVGLELLKLLTQSSLPVREITLYNRNHIEVVLSSRQIVLFNASKDLARAVDALQFILRNSKMEDKQIVRVDLRFDNPVVE